MQCAHLIKLAPFTVAMLLFSSCVTTLAGQTPDASADESQSWTKTTESHTANMNPTRTTESHQKSVNGTVDHQTVERLGPDGHYEPYYDIDRESVQVDATTIRTTERTFARDANGQKILTRVTEEEKQSLPAGGEKVLRTMSNADLDGHLQVVQREVTNTKKLNPEEQEKNTTVFLSDGQGGMVPSLQVQQREKRGTDRTIDVQTSTLLPDGSGKWQVHERKESTTKEDGEGRTSEEQLLREGVDGQLTPVSRTVSKESKTSHDEKKNVIETYSPDVSGSAGSNLQLSQRVIEVKRKDTYGAQKIETRTEQRSLVDPAAGLQVTTKTRDNVQFTSSGRQETTTVEARDVSGTFTVVSFDTQKSDNVHAINVDIAPQNKTK